MPSITQGQVKRFTLGFLLASVLYFIVLWMIYDGPLVRMVPGMTAVAIMVGLFFVWSPPRRLGPPPP